MCLFSQLSVFLPPLVMVKRDQSPCWGEVVKTRADNWGLVLSHVQESLGTVRGLCLAALGELTTSARGLEESV